MGQIKQPKYDNETVTLGYLKKLLEKKGITESTNLTTISRNYSSPPNPPYYKDSLLIINNKIYRCNKTRLVGLFNWEDWILITDNQELNDFIEHIYKTDKLEIEEQMDNKIESYYQETDPSLNWPTSIEKEKHVGDYWYNTTNNTQWRYNKITTTTPISYEWGQVNIPSTVYDMIDSKKSIYTSKPSSYKKDDMWIIEETISDEDLPIGTEENPIQKGDWVFALSDSDKFDKSHWVKKDEKVDVEYLNNHYYTTELIDQKFEVVNSNITTEITKSKEDILLEVSSEYTTKETFTTAINDYDEKIGTITENIKTNTEEISALNIEKDSIKQTLSSIETKTTEIENNMNEYYKKTEVDTIVEQTKDGINTTISSVENLVNKNTNEIEKTVGEMAIINETLKGMQIDTSKIGGNNLLKNAIGYFGQNSWEGGGASPYSDTYIKNKTGQKSCWLLNDGTHKQTIQVKNGTYTLSFMFEKLISASNITFKLNDIEYSLVENNIITFNVTNNIITLEFSGNVNMCAYIMNLMLNEGTIASPYSNNANETVTDSITLGEGIFKISSDGINTEFIATANAIGFENKNTGEMSTEFSTKGTSTNELTANKATIAKVIIKDTGSQTIFNRL